MFGLTKREQRWAAEQKAAETIVPLITAAVELAKNERIAELEAEVEKWKALHKEANENFTRAARLCEEAQAMAARLINDKPGHS